MMILKKSIGSFYNNNNFFNYTKCHTTIIISNTYILWCTILFMVYYWYDTHIKLRSNLDYRICLCLREYLKNMHAHCYQKSS